MPQADDERWISSFIAALSHVRDRDDRASLTKLRRGLTNNPAERDLWVFSHLEGAAARHEDPAMLVAALFASHPATGGRGSLGAALRKVRTETSSESIDKRLATLLDSHRDDLPARLRQTVSLLKSKEVPIDWRQLLQDLIDWGKLKGPVQRRWARDYWIGRGGSTPSVTTETESLAVSNSDTPSPSEESTDDR